MSAFLLAVRPAIFPDSGPPSDRYSPLHLPTRRNPEAQELPPRGFRARPRPRPRPRPWPAPRSPLRLRFCRPNSCPHISASRLRDGRHNSPAWLGVDTEGDLLPKATVVVGERKGREINLGGAVNRLAWAGEGLAWGSEEVAGVWSLEGDLK